MSKDKNFTVTMFIWLALLGSVFMYILIAFIMKDKTDFLTGRELTNTKYEILLGIFAFISLISGTLSILARKNILKEKFYKKMIKTPSAQSVYLITIIFSLALAETITILGLVLFFMTLKFKIFLVFAFVSISLILLNKPNLEEFTNFKTNFNKENIEDSL